MYVDLILVCINILYICCEFGSKFSPNLFVSYRSTSHNELPRKVMQIDWQSWNIKRSRRTEEVLALT